MKFDFGNPQKKKTALLFLCAVVGVIVLMLFIDMAGKKTGEEPSAAVAVLPSAPASEMTDATDDDTSAGTEQGSAQDTETLPDGTVAEPSSQDTTSPGSDDYDDYEDLEIASLAQSRESAAIALRYTAPTNPDLLDIIGTDHDFEKHLINDLRHKMYDAGLSGEYKVVIRDDFGQEPTGAYIIYADVEGAGTYTLIMNIVMGSLTIKAPGE